MEAGFNRDTLAQTRLNKGKRVLPITWIQVLFWNYSHLNAQYKQVPDISRLLNLHHYTSNVSAIVFVFAVDSNKIAIKRISQLITSKIA